MKIKSPIAALSLFLALSGCTFHSRPWTIDAGETVLATTATNEACANVLVRNKDVASVKLLYDATISRNNERYDMRLAFVYREPGAARLELLPIRGAMSLGLAVFSPEGGIALEPAEHRAFRSLSEKKLIEEILPGFSFSIPELLMTLMGNLPSQACSSQTDFQWTTKGTETFIVERSDRGGTWQISRNGEVQKFIRRDDLSSASPLYIEYTRSSTNEFPTKILVSIPSVSSKISLTLSQGAKNVAISDRALSVTIPEDFEVRDL